ncbi:DUF4266 domain-containing protein [Pseudomaricurvus alcaniphilus]|uniref:DUF4266 domain-containing protein n=1 Tax=Pseudomaricurvus alcaniphilus TaxID=1166482 RepID=UPI001408D056|nr:DUF4266 domain-containing protein [Pseudomaricurvus alcaniphilus]NHN37779.1 DUF4266 domain-containing protein [Pseudomaricurvus alcaniphilus]
MIKLSRCLLLAAACAGSALLSGCSNFTPWVKPYERQNLADPIMSFDRDAIATRYLNHVYESREAARGAEGSAGGGCGCN